MAIYKPLKVSTIPTMLYNLRSESSTGFELLTEFMLTDVVEETMRLGVDNGRLQLDLNSEPTMTVNPRPLSLTKIALLAYP